MPARHLACGDDLGETVTAPGVADAALLDDVVAAGPAASGGRLRAPPRPGCRRQADP